MNTFEIWLASAREVANDPDGRELYPDHDRVMQFSDGGIIAIGDKSYYVLAGRDDGEFEHLEDAARLLWREHSQFNW